MEEPFWYPKVVEGDWDFSFTCPIKYSLVYGKLQKVDSSAHGLVAVVTCECGQLHRIRLEPELEQ